MESDGFFLDLNDRGGFVRTDGPLISPPVIDIYLAGPLTHAEPLVQKECNEIRAAVKTAFQGFDYLGVKFLVYDPAEVTAPGTNHSAEEVYITDHKRTVTSDVVFFHVSAPSLGVGIEAQLSASATTPRVILRKRCSPSSRMFAGLCASTITEIEYDSPMDVLMGLLQLRPDICPAIIESAERRRPHLEEIKQQRLGEKFFMQRIRKGIPIVEVARKADIPEFWLREIERCPELGCTLSTMNIQRISDVLGCSVKNQQGKFELVDLANSPNLTQYVSLENLARHLNGRNSFNEDRAFRAWGRYCKEDDRQRAEAKRYRGKAGDSESLTEEDWRKFYDDSNLFD